MMLIGCGCAIAVAAYLGTGLLCHRLAGIDEAGYPALLGLLAAVLGWRGLLRHGHRWRLARIRRHGQPVTGRVRDVEHRYNPNLLGADAHFVRLDVEWTDPVDAQSRRRVCTFYFTEKDEGAADEFCAKHPIGAEVELWVRRRDMVVDVAATPAWWERC